MRSSLRQMFMLVVISFISLSAQVKPIRVACIGNSITNGGGGETAYPQQLGKLLGKHYDVKNYGVSGRTLLKKGDFPYWKEETFQIAKDFDPQIVIIKLGTNDSKPQNWIYKNEFYSDFMDFVKEFRKNNRNPQIFVCRPCPVFQLLAGINGTIVREEIIPLTDSVRKSSNSYLIDFYTPMLDKSSLFPDGVHPNATGYALMAQIAYDAIIKGPAGIIRYFNSKQTSFEKGQSCMLYWETTTGSQVTIDGKVVKETDSLIVSPTQTTTYTLIAKGERSDTSKVTIQYYPPGKIKSFTAIPIMIEKEANETSQLSWLTSVGSTVTLDGIAVDANGSKSVSPKTSTTYQLISSGETKDTSKVTVQVLDAVKINRSLSRTVKASSTNKNFPPEAAIDGNPATYWRSGAETSPWIYVDLGKTLEINRVVLSWGNIYATSYHLQTISEAGDIANLYSNSSGDGGIDEISGLAGSARYLRLLCITKSVPDSGCVLKEFEIYGTVKTSSIVDEEILPSKFHLDQNYPNPFNPTTTIKYSIPAVVETRHSSSLLVSLKVYDILGREVVTLVDEEKKPGNYEIKFNVETLKATSLPSGIYFYQLKFNDFIQTKKFVLLK